MATSKKDKKKEEEQAEKLTARQQLRDIRKGVGKELKAFGKTGWNEFGQLVGFIKIKKKRRR